MRYMLRTDGTEFEVSKTAVPKTDMNGAQKIDSATKMPVWSVELTIWTGEDQGADVVTVSIPAPVMPVLRWREPVEVVDLEMLPWAQKRRDGELHQGVAFRAADIRPVRQVQAVAA